MVETAHCKDKPQHVEPEIGHISIVQNEIDTIPEHTNARHEG